MRTLTLKTCSVSFGLKYGVIVFSNGGRLDSGVGELEGDELAEVRAVGAVCMSLVVVARRLLARPVL